MGWTTTHRDKHTTVQAFLIARNNCRNEHGSWEVLDCATVRNTVYMAIRRTLPDGSNYVFAAVTLTKHWPRAKDGYNFGWKDMDESSGPCESECPARILKLLSPLDPDDEKNRHAMAWRARCLEHIARKKALVKRQSGQLVFLPRGAVFKGFPEREHYFLYQRLGRRSLYLAIAGGFHCRLSRELERELEDRTLAELTAEAIFEAGYEHDVTVRSLYTGSRHVWFRRTSGMIEILGQSPPGHGELRLKQMSGRGENTGAGL